MLDCSLQLICIFIPPSFTFQISKTLLQQNNPILYVHSTGLKSVDNEVPKPHGENITNLNLIPSSLYVPH